MNHSEARIEIKKLAPTTKGSIEITDSSDILILAHENLHPQISKIASQPLNAQTLYFHKNNPLTLQNSSVTPSLIDHEIHVKLKKQQLKQVLIIDSSILQNQKTADVFKKYNVVRGYNYQLPSAVSVLNTQTLSKESEVLISKEHIEKELNYVLKSQGDQQRGFIGQIDLPYHYRLSSSSHLYHQAFINVLSSYQKYSSSTDCPIYVNLLEHGFNAYNTQSQSRNPTQLNKIIEFLLTVLSNKEVYKKIVLINPLFQINRIISQHQIIYENANKEFIIKLYQLGFNLCFDLSRYQNQNCLIWIANFMKQWASQSILSAGLKFKTDFRLFSGEGLLMDQSFKIMNLVLANNSSEIYKLTLKQNTIKLHSWKTKTIQFLPVKTWKCMKCGKDSPQTEQSFRKFGKDFCSIDCLRSFKF